MDESYLPLVCEEAAEIIEACCKAQRFGPEGFWVKQGCTNAEAIALEVGDLLEVLLRLGVSPVMVEKGRARKSERLKRFGPDEWTPAVTEEKENERVDGAGAGRSRAEPE